MSWLPIKEVARISGKAERTLRLYASQGRVKAKKDGKEWLLEVASLKNVKIDLAAFTAKIPNVPNNAGKIAAKTAATAKPVGKISATPSRMKENQSARLPNGPASGNDSAKNRGNAARDAASSGKKYKLLKDLGVYRDLIDLWNSNSLEGMDDVATWLKYSIEQVAIGFYEFQAASKVHCFRLAREGVVKAIVGINLTQNHQAESLVGSLENDIVPGLIGLIKRYEKMKP